MRLIRGRHNAGRLQRPCVVTIGNFDGVHRGHQALLGAARAQADALGLPLTVLTFEPTPREVFAPESAPLRVTTLRTKLEDLARFGVDQVLVQRFGPVFARTSPEAFAAELLARDLGARAVIVGDDFRYGHRRAGDFDRLRSAGTGLGFTVAALDTVPAAGERCSSTRLRAALAAGDLDLAEALLGRPYALCARVRHGRKLGRRLSMPTANLPLTRRLALRYGVYAVQAQVGERWLPGVANYGSRPTLGGTPALLEVHCLPEPGDLYGRLLTVRFCRHLRDEQRFESLEALKAQMHRDRTAAADWFAYTR